MSVAAQNLEVEPDGESPLEAEADLRPPVGKRAAPLPEASVRVEEVDVAADDLVEVRAPDLLLALDDPADPHRELAARLAHRSNRCEPNRKLGLVVGRAAREQLPVAHRRLERRRLPEVERIDRLHVVVVVQEEREVAGARELAVDRRRGAVDRQLPCLEAGAGEQLLDELRGLRELLSLGRDARLPAEELEDAQGVAFDRLDVDSGRRHGPIVLPGTMRTLTYGGAMVSTWSVLRMSCEPRSPVGLVKQPEPNASADNELALAA